MNAKISLVVVLFIVSLPRLSFGEMYQWINSDGSVGITDEISKVPEKYRSQVERKKYQAVSETETNKTNDISSHHAENENLRLNNQNSRGLSPQTKQEIESTVFSLWNKFRYALSRKDMTTALDCIELSQRRIYQQNFNLLKDHLQEIAAELTDLGKCVIRDGATNVECEIVSNKGGQTQASPVHFVRDLEGVWKIYFF
jgi:hypothetical protein